MMSESELALGHHDAAPEIVDGRRVAEGKVWTTREGKRIPVAEMTTNHIENALAMLRRNGVVSPKCVAAYVFDAGPSGDSAHDTFINECREIFGAPSHPAVDWFKDELARRKNNE